MLQALPASPTLPLPLLILGPTGSGKSRLARELHARGARSRGPFVEINLASLSESTFESELFGHVRGAFTGADRARPGRLRQAAGGTAFLDEIGELTPRQQLRLLEFLQTREVTPVGSESPVRVDALVMAATNRDLEADVRAGRFRADLWFRLRGQVVELPPLRDRPESLDELVHVLIEELCRQQGKSIRSLSEEAALLIESHDWPGNVRELRHALEHAIAAAPGSRLERSHFPSWMTKSPGLKPVDASGGVPSELVRVLEIGWETRQREWEGALLRAVAEECGGNLSLAARRLRLSKTTFLRKWALLQRSADRSQKVVAAAPG